MARTVVFDFDGVIHSYTSGWQGEDAIPDPPVPGIREALKEIHDAGYEVVVVSTRCATIKGHGAIEAWLYDNGLREYIDKVCKEKPPAVAYIDDRAICFDGHPETLLKKIQNFQPWYKMPTLTPPNEPLTLDKKRVIAESCLHYRKSGCCGLNGYAPLDCPKCKEWQNNEPNEPLTLEQLQEMDEPTPVWWKRAGCWCLCERGFIIAPNGNIYEFEETDGTFYRHPPEGEEDT